MVGRQRRRQSKLGSDFERHALGWRVRRL